MHSTKRTASIILAGATSLLLAACGGGGDGAAYSDPPTSNQLEKYVGTWESNSCELEEGVTQKNNGESTPTYVKDTLIITKTNSTKLNFKLINKYYAHTDSKCNGQAVLTMILTGESKGEFVSYGPTTESSFGENILSYVDSKTIEDTVADRFDIEISPLQTTPNNTIGMGFFNVVIDGNQFFFGTGKAIAKVMDKQLSITVEPDTFAESFAESSTYTKQ